MTTKTGADVDVLRAVRVLSGKRRGSSRPIVVETEAGPRVVKLRGAAQGTGPLVAEIIVAALAQCIGLAVPPRSLVQVAHDIDVHEGDDELYDLMVASAGLSLGFDYLADARDVTQRGIDAIRADDRTAILWLDRLVLNADRTARNPNLLWSAEQLWLIDHGAAMSFQYDWASVTEATPRRPAIETEPHLFASSVSADDLVAWDEILAARLTREAIDAAVALVPDTFLVPLLPSLEAPRESGEALRRRRAEYVAFLSKRLESPRPFLHAVAPTTTAVRGRPPRWLTRR